MEIFKGLVYIKHGRIGSKSEGPDYYLQSWDMEYMLKYADRNLWNPDYYLEFFCRKLVEVNGEIHKETIEGRIISVIKVISINEICGSYIPPKSEIQLSDKLQAKLQEKTPEKMQ
jgi:hypothetical protein